MIKMFFKIANRRFNNLIFLLVIPVGVFYVFPYFFIMLQHKWGIPVFKHDILPVLGIIIADVGIILAIWCIAIMAVYKKGALLSFEGSQNFMCKGPYRFVLHPMLLSMHIILLGEIVFLQSPFLLVWLVVWARFSHLYVVHFKEPFLMGIYGKAYTDYWRKTAWWLPGVWWL